MKTSIKVRPCLQPDQAAISLQGGDPDGSIGPHLNIAPTMNTKTVILLFGPNL